MTDHTDTHSLYVLSQPSWNRNQLTGGLVLHRSRLCCAWSRCLNDLLEEWISFATDGLGLKLVKHTTE